MWVEHLNTVNFSVLQLAAVDTILSKIAINSKNGSCGSKAWTAFLMRRNEEGRRRKGGANLGRTAKEGNERAAAGGGVRQWRARLRWDPYSHLGHLQC
jgi:hypothetical protein